MRIYMARVCLGTCLISKDFHVLCYPYVEREFVKCYMFLRAGMLCQPLRDDCLLDVDEE